MPQFSDTQTTFFHLFQLLLASLDATHSQPRTRTQCIPASPWHIIPFPVTPFTDWQVLTHSVFLWKEMDRRHCRSLTNLIPLLCTFTRSFWRCKTRAGCYSDKSSSIHSDVLYFALNTSLLEGGCFWFDCYSVMSSFNDFYHLKTLLQSHNDQHKSSLSCIGCSNYFPCTSYLPMLSQLGKPKMQSRATVN